MLIVKAGVGPHTIIRSCRDRMEAEDWARKCIRSGIAPVVIDGKVFDPESRTFGPVQELAEILRVTAYQAYAIPTSPPSMQEKE